MSDSGDAIPMSQKTKKKLFFFALLTTLLLVSAVVGIVAGVNSRKNSGADNIHFTPSHHLVKTACSSTLYPELCFSTITAEPGFTDKVSTHRDVIELSLNITIRSVRHNRLNIDKIRAKKGLSKRQKVALHDCVETIVDTIFELRRIISNLKYSSNRAEDIRTFLSTAITNQETCRDGFAHNVADRRVRRGLDDGQVHVERLCSNALAMFRNMTDHEVPSGRRNDRNVMEMVEVDGGTWPAWMTAKDRRLLLSESEAVTPNVVVAADGSGNYKTVSEAVAAAPSSSSTRYVIRIKAGVYRENVEVPSSKTNIMFMGDGRSNTVITGSRNVVDGSTTFNSPTVAVVGDGFLAREITFQNSAGPTKEQAVALRTGSDLSAFYRCAFLAYQDTLYVHSNRQFFTDCVVVGTVDFIFGNSAAVLQNCDIRPRLPLTGQKNMVTAQGRTDQNQNTGIVIQNSKISANSDLEAHKGSVKSYLGRPWKDYSRTVIMKTNIDNVIDPAGWHYWENETESKLSTLFYGEYQNTGTGADTSKRVNWKGFKVITSASEAQAYTVQNFISGSNWLNNTGFLYTLGL